MIFWRRIFATRTPNRLHGHHEKLEETQDTFDYSALAPINRVYYKPPTTFVPLEHPGRQVFKSMVIVFEDGSYLSTDENPFMEGYPPIFVYHALSILIGRGGQRPAVRSGHYCWVTRRDGLRNHVICLLVGRALAADQFHSIFAAYQYDSASGGSKITQGGILVVPARNVYGCEKKVWYRAIFQSELYRGWLDLPENQEHHEVQLLFQSERNDESVGAEWIPGTHRYGEQLHLMENREHLKRRRDSTVRRQWRKFVG